MDLRGGARPRPPGQGGRVRRVDELRGGQREPALPRAAGPGGARAGRRTPGGVPVPLGPALDLRGARGDGGGLRPRVQRARGLRGPARRRGPPRLLRLACPRAALGPVVSEGAPPDPARPAGPDRPVPTPGPRSWARGTLPEGLLPATLAVRGGQVRSHFEETSEALF